MSHQRHRVVIFAPFYPPAFRGGGPIRSLSSLVQATSESYGVSVVTRSKDLGSRVQLPITPDVWLDSHGARVRYVSTRSLRQYGRGLLAARCERPNLVYFNSFFDAAMSIVPQLVGLLGFWKGTVRVIAVRGEFGQAALGIRASKKRLYLRLYRILGLHRDVIWQASSEREAADIKKVMGETAQIVVRSDHSQVEPRTVTPSTTSSKELRAVFLGRIVPIKGLDLLLQAMATTTPAIQLDIYGPEEDVEYVMGCKSLSKALPETMRVRWLGPVEPDEVQATLSDYDVFLAPTHGENFGHVFAEALSVGLPVVAMNVTPWTAVLEAGGGIVVGAPTPEAWSAALTALASSTVEGRYLARVRALDAFLAWQEAFPRTTVLDDVLSTTPPIRNEGASP